ncbi:MAG: cyclase family protein [Elusimicrobia bacterium]|nr:cyclase family protein [Elusimicrobiota bacterium]
MAGWIDMTAPLTSSTPYYPGDPQFSFKWIKRIGVNGRRSNLSVLSLGSHAGTHIDAPLHFLKRGLTLDKISLGALMGPCQVIVVSHDHDVTEQDLKIWTGTPRVIFKTVNTRRRLMSRRRFSKNYAALTLSAAQALTRRGVRLVGMDYLSVEKFGVAKPVVHWELLRAQAVIVEGLDLSRVKAGLYDLACLPLKVNGAEGAPCRAILKKR